MGTSCSLELVAFITARLAHTTSTSPSTSLALSVRRRCFLPLHHFPKRLPVQAAQGPVHHQVLPPQHQLERIHLPRHSQGSVESSSDSLQSSSLDLLHAYGPEPRRPAGP